MFYLFDMFAEKQNALIPENYSVLHSEYEPGNDFMYVFARLDENANGKQDDSEPIHIFWIDLKDLQKQADSIDKRAEILKLWKYNYNEQTTTHFVSFPIILCLF